MTPPIKSLPLFPACVCGNSDCIIPFGECHCGCGRKTSICNHTCNKRGHRRGFPMRYCGGHNSAIVYKILENYRDRCLCGDEKCKVLYGYCHCGCGYRTAISRHTNEYRKSLKGVPHLFVRGHSILRPHVEPRADGICVCLQSDCTTPYGYCHCGCGRKTSLNKRAHGRGSKVGDPYLFVKWHRKNSKRINMDGAAPFKIDGVYCRLISITRGQYAIVWETDYEWLTSWIWQAHKREGATFYAGRSGNIYMHMEILGLKKDSGLIGDHINGNTLDNRRANLRIVTRSENAMNRVRQKNNNTGFTGVRIEKSGKYSSSIVAYNRIIRLGRFDLFEEAKSARLAAEIEYHGEFSGRSRQPKSY